MIPADNTLQALTRFGLGPRLGEQEAIGSNPGLWLQQQVAQGVPQVKPDAQAVRLTEQLIRLERAEAAKDGKKDARKAIRESYIGQCGRQFIAVAKSDQPFIERLVMFWTNHFTVSIQKPVIAALVYNYEAEAIRPFVLGSFSDMLVAAVQHPAMLLYLDNARSVGPDSMAGLRRDKGLNENVAREILELHTLGVDGGYTQQDVTEFAKILTGWSLDRTWDGDVRLEFAFQPRLHEPGSKTLMGNAYNSGGISEGLEALRFLARQPATARHIAAKLARHFIADEPPESAVQRLAQVFLDSGGDLKQVSLALIYLQEAWDQPLAKLKNPYEFAVSAMRLLALDPTAEQAMRLLDTLDYRPFNALSPAGYADTAQQWASPDAIMKRIELSYAIAGRVKGARQPAEYFDAAIGPLASDETRETIERAASATDAVALLLASPEFQRR